MIADVLAAVQTGLSLVLAPVPVRPPPPADSIPGPTASLVTFGVGAEIWERFGHNALWIHDPSAGTDQAYDYGRFDFGQPRFFLRFAEGRMAYSMDAANVEALFRFYASRHRSIVVQELNLAPAQVRSLRARLEHDLQQVHSPAGWSYAYDYYRDNCSTRLRDALDMVTGGAIQRALNRDTLGSTYRSNALRALAHRAGLVLGVDLLLGSPTDRRITAWQEAFLPEKLQEHLRVVQVTGPTGAPEPVVRSEHTVAVSDRYTVPADVRGWGWRFAAVGVAIGGGLLALARWGKRRAFVALAAGWGLIAGGAGLVLLWFWVGSAHWATYWNANLFQANVLDLLLLAGFARLVRVGGGERNGAREGAWRWVRWGGTLAAGFSLAGVLASASGLFDQGVGPAALVALPIHLGVALGVGVLVPRNREGGGAVLLDPGRQRV